MLPEGVFLSIAIRADFWQPQKKTKEKRNWSNIEISVLSSTVWTYTCRYQKSCIQPCHGHFTVIIKRPKMCRNSSSSSSNSSSSHFLFPRDFSKTIEDTDIINTPLEPVRPQMCLLGVSLILLPILGVKHPQNPNFEAWIGFFKPNGQIILKVSCYRNYCIDFNQIWHNDRDHQVVIVDGPSRRPTNPRWRTAAIF